MKNKQPNSTGHLIATVVMASNLLAKASNKINTKQMDKRKWLSIPSPLWVLADAS